jgi:hypothetical protein
MAQLLAHNMSLIKPVSAWPKGASAAIVGFNVTGGFNAYYIVASGCTPFRHHYSGVARRLLEARALEQTTSAACGGGRLLYLAWRPHLHLSGPDPRVSTTGSCRRRRRIDSMETRLCRGSPPHSPSLGGLGGKLRRFAGASREIRHVLGLAGVALAHDVVLEIGNAAEERRLPGRDASP